jgi:hypothetical protein
MAAELEALGIIRVLPDERWELPAPALFRAAEELAAFDFPLDRRIQLMEQLRAHSDQMADLLVGFFVDHMWPGPTTRAVDDPEAWDTLTQAVDRLRPLATTSVVALLDLAMARAAERAAEQMLVGEEPAEVVAPPEDGAGKLADDLPPVDPPPVEPNGHG